MEYYAIPDTIGVAAGTIDDDGLMGKLDGPVNHIFVAEKAEWYTIPSDGLRRYTGFPEEFQKAIDAWRKKGM